MKTTINFIDQLKYKTGLHSDYAIAPKLGVTRAQVSKYRHKKDYFSPRTAIHVAELLGIPPAIVLVSVAAEREKDQAAQAVWNELYEQLKTAGGVDISQFDEPVSSPGEAVDGSGNCILCKIRAPHQHRLIVH